MNPEQFDSLENRLADLQSRVRLIEEALRTQSSNIPKAEAAASQRAYLPPPIPARVPATEPGEQRMDPIGTVANGSNVLPSFTAVMPRVGDEELSLENRIASRWFNRIGILAVLIAAAWFLKLAIDNGWIGHWIGPSGRVLLGLAAGAGLVVWSERFRGNGYAAFSYSLKAVGSGVLYLSLWAAFALYALIPASLAFAAMIAVTAFNAFMAWVQDAELLALYAIAGALTTPLLISTGDNHEVTLFSYLLLLDIAMLVLVALRPWSRLLFGAFVGTVLFYIGWSVSFYSNAQMARTACFLGCFFLIFSFAPRIVRIGVDENANSSAWDRLALVVLPIANAALGFLGFHWLLVSSHMEWSLPWLAVIFAAFYLLLLRLPEWGRLHASPAPLSSLHLAAAVVFLTIAIPLKAQGRWLTIGWLAEGAALLWVESRVRLTLLRVLALLCLVLGFGALLVVNPPAATTPFLNQRFASYCVGIAVFTFVAWMANKVEVEDERTPILQWRTLAALSLLIVNFLILLAIAWEIHSYWWNLRWREIAISIDGYHVYTMYAQFTYSAFFMAFGAILLGVGFWRRSAFLRWQGLVLLAITIGKVFLLDMGELNQGYRILSFLGLGALLLTVSFTYQRDWLKLRGQKATE